MVAKAQKFNKSDIKKWSDREGHGEKFDVFLEKLKE
jgi:hypothetical protein